MTANFKDTGDLNKALIGYFQYISDTELHQAISDLRKIRNTIEHNKFIDDNLFNNALYALKILREANKYELNICDLIIELYNEIKEAMISCGVTVRIKDTTTVTIKDTTVTTKGSSQVTDSSEEKTTELEPKGNFMIATFAQLKNSKYHLRSGDDITMMDGKYAGIECKFFRWNGNNCFVFLPGETLPKSMIINRKVKLDLNKKLANIEESNIDAIVPNIINTSNKSIQSFADAVKG